MGCTFARRIHMNDLMLRVYTRVRASGGHDPNSLSEQRSQRLLYISLYSALPGLQLPTRKVCPFVLKV